MDNPSASGTSLAQRGGMGRDIWLGLPILLGGYYFAAKFAAGSASWWENLIYVSLPLLALGVFAAGFGASRRSTVFGLFLAAVVLLALVIAFWLVAVLFADPAQHH